MFEEKIAALNKANELRMEHMASLVDKRVYTVDEIQDILGSIIRNCNFEFTGYYLGTLVSIETGFSYAPV